jgi:hypothetical protein
VQSSVLHYIYKHTLVRLILCICPWLLVALIDWRLTGRTVVLGSLFEYTQTLIAHMRHVDNFCGFKASGPKVHLVERWQVELGSTVHGRQKDTVQDFGQGASDLGGTAGCQKDAAW